MRSRRLDQIDETKLALAVFLMARRLVEGATEPTHTGGKPVEAAVDEREVA